MTNSLRDRTYRLERIRALAGGVLESADATFIMLIAVQVLAADNTAKGILSGGARVGMLLAPVMVLLAERIGLPSGRIAASLLVLSAIGYAIPIFVPSLMVYVPLVMIGAASAAMLSPFTTQIYQSNYQPTSAANYFHAPMSSKSSPLLFLANWLGVFWHATSIYTGWCWALLQLWHWYRRHVYGVFLANQSPKQVQSIPFMAFVFFAAIAPFWCCKFRGCC